MKVILLENVKNLGKKYDVKEVSDGYGRNFLLRNNLAKIATKKDIEMAKQKAEKEKEKQEKDLGDVKSLAEKIRGQKVEIDVKVGEKDQLFESVGAQKISEKLNEMGFKIKEEDVQLETPIKELGEYEVTLKLKYDIQSSVKVIITKEK